MPSTFRLAITEPTAIDPYRAQEVEGILVTKALYVGLLALERSNRLIPAVAASWECADDGRTWVFRLRDDVLFSTGKPVDAHAFVRAWNRAADPAAGSETTYHLAGIRGYAEVQAGSSETLAGVSAPDPATLVVELSTPDFEFDKKTLQPIFLPVPISDTAIDVHTKYGRLLPTGHSTMHMYPIDGAASRVPADATAFAYRDGGWAGIIAGVDPDPRQRRPHLPMGPRLPAGPAPHLGRRRLHQLPDERRPGPDQSLLPRQLPLAHPDQHHYDPGNIHINQNVLPASEPRP